MFQKSNVWVCVRVSHSFFRCLTNIFLPNKDFNKEFVARFI